jgi:hypothetical protein
MATNTGFVRGAGEPVDVGIHAHLEQQQDDADFGQDLQGRAGRDPTQ